MDSEPKELGLFKLKSRF